MSSSRNLFSILSWLTVFSAVRGCVPLPVGQGRNVSFVVTGFSLPVGMVWTTQQVVLSQLPSVSGSDAAARALVQRLVARAVLDTLEEEGHRAGLGGAITSAILQQVAVHITYPPLRCDAVAIQPALATNNMVPGGVMNPQLCIVFGNTVSNICTMNCMLNMPNQVAAVPSQHLTIGGTITVTNFIIANWSNQMWQAVLNRVARSLASGPFGTNFARLSVTVF